MKVAALVVGLVIAVAVLWAAGEQHRQTCIEKAQVDYPALVDPPAGEGAGLSLGDGSRLDPNAKRRRRAAADCSILPL